MVKKKSRNQGNFFMKKHNLTPMTQLCLLYLRSFIISPKHLEAKKPWISLPKKLKKLNLKFQYFKKNLLSIHCFTMNNHFTRLTLSYYTLLLLVHLLKNAQKLFYLRFSTIPKGNNLKNKMEFIFILINISTKQNILNGSAILYSVSLQTVITGITLRIITVFMIWILRLVHLQTLSRIKSKIFTSNSCSILEMTMQKMDCFHFHT